ncbi:MAG: SIS domain-containing protein [Acidobacteria bacterium]|nr:SIS domain-containing protein [Acidobacteriota bacterium]MCZ6768421.1 SIS domain-containing protein [Acidobacteriota bacterium]MCZ6876513.1 SIS domain-containing protein [Acidobacteriota bacterium]
MGQNLSGSDRLDYLKSYKEKSLAALEKIAENDVAQLIELLSAAREAGRQIFLCGNGGSAATASHFANDLGKGASFGHEKRFRVLALTDNVSWMTALANDTDYSQIFVEQLKNYARPEDLLITFSGSGNSPNVLEVVQWANQNSMLTVGITGRPGGKLGELARYPVFVESSHMGHIEEGHFLIQHLVGYYFMETEQ